MRVMALLGVCVVLALGCTDPEKQAWVKSRCTMVENDEALYKSCTADAALDYDNGIR